MSQPTQDSSEANAPIFGIDTSGKINVWNAKAASMLGFSREEIGKGQMGSALMGSLQITFLSTEGLFGYSR